MLQVTAGRLLNQCVLMVLLWCVVSMAAAPAMGQGVSVSLSSEGLSEFMYNGVELLEDGEFQLQRAIFRRSDGTMYSSSNILNSQAFDSSQSKIIRNYEWGSVSLKYGITTDRLSMQVEVQNRTDSDVLEHIALELMVLGFPQEPIGFDGTPRLASNIGSPSIVGADYGTNLLAIVNDDSLDPLMIGYPYSIGDRVANTTYPLWLWTGDHPSMNTTPSYIDRPITPGGTEQFNVSMRFAESGTNAYQTAPDLRDAVRQHEPFVVDWMDRRPIGTLFLANSATYSDTNPRKWFADPNINVTTPEGIAEFHQRVLDYADRSIGYALQMNAQGVIAWDIEGKEYPHPVTYIGDPRIIAPEMEGVIDQFFQRFRDAGLNVGLTVRPQQLVITDSGPRQINVDDPYQQLCEKIDYAKDRWAVNMFYIDSNRGSLEYPDAELIRQLAERYPDVLLIPEHENLYSYSASAPYTQLNRGSLGTGEGIRYFYPEAFGILNVGQGSFTEVAEHWDELVSAVNSGDILLFRSWWDDPFNEMIKQIYDESHMPEPAGLTLLSVGAVVLCRRRGKPKH